MGVFTYENENTSSVAPAKLFKALVFDADDIIPKVVEQIQSIETVEGNGGPGSVKKLTFVDGGATKHVLHKVEGLDEASFGYEYSIVGGDGLPEAFEKISFKNKLVATADGGSVAKVTITYYTKGDAPPSEEELKTGKVKRDGLFRAVEGYVLANLDKY